MEKMNINVTGNQKEIIVREGEAAEVFNYQGQHYEALSTDAFVTLVKKRKTDNTVVGYHDTGFKAILDDSVIDMPQDEVCYEFRKSLQMIEWEHIFNHPMTQKEFIKFLKSRRTGTTEEIESIDILTENVKRFKFVTNISADYSTDDDNNFTFMYKSKDGEGTVDIPQEIMAYIQILENSDLISRVEVEISVQRPKSEQEKPTFTLNAPTLKRHIEAAEKYEQENLRKLLKDVPVIVVAAKL